MKAAQLNRYGGVDSISINEVAVPLVDRKEVLIAVEAAGVNPFDWKVREGYMKDFIPLKLPATLGGDVAGTVSKIGEGVTGFEIGQKVYGSANAAGGRGSFAEYTPVSANQLAAPPKGLSSIEAAALPLAATSAYQALVEHMQLKPGKNILIHGGAGGIGSFALQIAKHIGARVITTASVADAAFVRQLGADKVIDYQNQDFTDVAAAVDAVFDTVGGETNAKSYRVLKKGGILVSMVEPANDAAVQKAGITYVQQTSQATAERLKRINELVENGELQVHIAKVFPLVEAAGALEYLKAGHPKGKVVIEVQ